MTLRQILSGIRNVIKHEGLPSLISRGLVFLLRRTLWIEEYYVIFMNTHRNPEDKEEDFIPKSGNCCLKILTTNKEADDLLAEGFTFGAYELNLRASFDKNVVSFCLFVKREFAHVSCLADNPRGKATVDPRPFDVDYQNGEVVVGRALTVPKFRRLYLKEYNGYVFRKYYLERGVNRILHSVNAHSLPALAVAAHAPDRPIKSRCRLTRILWFTHLEETKMENASIKQIVSQMTVNQKKRNGHDLNVEKKLRYRNDIKQHI
jgi:hypothetical protein